MSSPPGEAVRRPVLVQKFGGSSLSTAFRIKRAAQRIVRVGLDPPPAASGKQHLERPLAAVGYGAGVGRRAGVANAPGHRLGDLPCRERPLEGVRSDEVAAGAVGDTAI